MKIIQGNLNSAKYRFAIILSRFNEYIGDHLLEGAIQCFKKYGCTEDSFDIFKVPGAYEIPVTAEKLAEQNKYNAIVCLGAVIKGDTPHFEFIAGSASNGIMQISIKYKVPVIFGILTTNTYEQALERIKFNPGQTSEESVLSVQKETGSGNKGWDAAETAIEMADLFMKINEFKPF